MKRVLDGLQEIIGSQWLQKKEYHRLRYVWHRKDAASTIELFTLGLAIETARKLDENWLSWQLDRVLSNDDNNCKGALFEILALANFNGGDLAATPTPPGNPGVDFILSSEEGDRIAVSVKTFGLTLHHQNFLRSFEKLRRVLLVKLQRWPYSSIQISVSGSSYPSCGNEWDELEASLSQAINAEHEMADSRGNWEFAITLPEGSVARRISDPLSHQFFAFCRSHPNEQKNYYDKFYDAMTNMIRHNDPVATGIRNMLLFRVPGSVYVTRLFEPLIQALKDLPDRPCISVAGLYQPSLVWSDDNSVSLSHFTHPIVRAAEKDWFDRALGTSKALMEVAVGVISSQPSRMLMKNDVGEAVFLPDDAYLYQCGERFMITRYTGAPQRFQLQQIAPGIRLNSLIEFPDGGRLELRGSFSNELSIVQEEATNLRDLPDERL